MKIYQKRYRRGRRPRRPDMWLFFDINHIGYMGIIRNANRQFYNSTIFVRILRFWDVEAPSPTVSLKTYRKTNITLQNKI